MGLRLGSPAANPCGSNCVGPSDPFQWWSQWQAACQSNLGRACKTDFYASHYYTCDPSALASCAPPPSPTYPLRPPRARSHAACDMHAPSRSTSWCLWLRRQRPRSLPGARRVSPGGAAALALRGRRLTRARARRGARYINEINQNYGQKVWITEWACPQPSGGLSGQVSFMRQALAVMDGNPAVERRAPAALPSLAPGHFPAWPALRSAARRQARTCLARPPSCRGGSKSLAAARGRYSWFAPDTSGSLFSWIGDTASLLNGNSVTSVGALYTGAAAALINAQAEGQAFNLTGLGMSPTEARARPPTMLWRCRRARVRLSDSRPVRVPSSAPLRLMRAARRARQEASVHKALTEPLPAIKTDGVWSQQCAPCIGQGEEGVPDRNFTSAAQEVRRPRPQPSRSRSRASKGVPAGGRPAVRSARASRRWTTRDAACAVALRSMPCQTHVDPQTLLWTSAHSERAR